MTASIVARDLTKFYGGTEVAALDKLSLEIKSGEVYGYLGANGAGKSTTIRLLLNLIQPTSGSAHINGFDIVRDSVAVKKQVGYLAGDVALYLKPTGRELLDYLSTLQPATTYRKELEKRFEADLDKPIGELSKGNRQKIGIIQAFMHEPDVLILDEPTSGLDPLMQEAFYQTVADCKERGAAVLMSSHNLAEAQRICTRVGIIKHGKLIHEQTIDHTTHLGATIFQVTFASPEDLKRCKQSKDLELVSATSNVSAAFKPTHTISSALSTLSHFDIHELSTQPPDLEDEFLTFYGDKS